MSMPITTSGKHTDHLAVAQKMKNKPGVWFKIATYGSRGSALTAASNIRNGVGALGAPGKPYQPIFDGAYDAKVRGESTVWARLVK